MFRSLRRYSCLAYVLSSLAYAHAGSAGETLMTASPAQRPMLAEEGLWLVEEKDGIFQIAPCTDHQDRLCGWLVGMDYTEAEPEKDIWGRSECGLQIISDMKRSRDGRWDGRILDPRSGRSYDARLWIAQSGQLKVLGYLGLPLFGQTQTWDRYRGAPIGHKCRMHRQ